MRIHVSLITWNRLSLTRLCLESLLRLYSLTIVDNGSSEGTRTSANTCRQEKTDVTASS